MYIKHIYKSALIIIEEKKKDKYKYFFVYIQTLQRVTVLYKKLCPLESIFITKKKFISEKN